MTMQHVNGHAGSAIIERVVAVGDLSGLQPKERVIYYSKVCESVGLNPLTQPFKYVSLQGKLSLYAVKDASDQLRAIHNISIRIVSRELDADGVLTVTARAMKPGGREDESIGCVFIGGLKGEALANAKMKAETKAKRRVTLSICGLGWLDETEVQDVRAAKHVEVTADGEIVEPPQPDLTKQLAASIDWKKWVTDHLGALRNAANMNRGRYTEAWADIMDDVKKCEPAKEHVEALNAGKAEIKASMGWK